MVFKDLIYVKSYSWSGMVITYIYMGYLYVKSTEVIFCSHYTLV